jgi:hypothetical protein
MKLAKKIIFLLLTCSITFCALAQVDANAPIKNTPVSNVWKLDGNPDFSPTYTSSALLVMNAAGNAYAGLLNGSTNKVSIMTLQKGATVWTAAGSALRSPVTSFSLAIDLANPKAFPYVAYQHDTSLGGGSLMVDRFDGKKWVVVGSGAISTEAGVINSQSLAVNKGIPYVLVNTRENNQVMAYTNHAWVSVGGSLSSAPYSAIQISSAGVIFVAWIDENRDIQVMKLQSGNWVQVGTTLADQNPQFAFALNSQGIPYIAYASGANDSPAVVALSADNTWETIGNFVAPYQFCEIWHDESLVIASDGRPYLSFIGFMTGNYVIAALTLNADNNWVPVGNMDFASPGSQPGSLILDAKNNPYIIYMDNADFDKTTVKTFG